MTLVVHRSTLPYLAEELFELHMDAGNLPAISPPFPPVRLLSAPKRAEPGDLQVIRFGWGRLGANWEARILRVVAGRLLEDVQERGPFREWRHQHRVVAVEGGAELTDAVSFRLLPGPVGEFIEFYVVRPFIKAMFVVRHRRTARLLANNKI